MRINKGFIIFDPQLTAPASSFSFSCCRKWNVKAMVTLTLDHLLTFLVLLAKILLSSTMILQLSSSSLV
jgi:hypothetical protein